MKLIYAKMMNQYVFLIYYGYSACYSHICPTGNMRFYAKMRNSRYSLFLYVCIKIKIAWTLII